MRRFATLALVLALRLSPALAADADEPAAAERLIREERSIASTILCAPYAIVSLTAWPVKKVVMFMESVNLPGRVGDVLRFPVRAFDDGEEP